MKALLLKMLYQVRNWRVHYRALVHGTATVVENAALTAVGMVYGTVTYTPSLSIKVIRAEKNRPTGWFKRLFWSQELDLGLVSRRVITTVGVKFLCDDFNAGTKDVANFKAHAMGEGTAAESAADTALGTEVESRVNGSQASATASPNATYTTVATITATSARAITEHGIFDSTTVAGSTLWDRSKFSVINLAIGDSIQFTYVLTANSGG